MAECNDWASVYFFLRNVYAKHMMTTVNLVSHRTVAMVLVVHKKKEFHVVKRNICYLDIYDLIIRKGCLCDMSVNALYGLHCFKAIR